MPVVVVLTYLFLSKDQEEGQNVVGSNVVAVLHLAVDQTMDCLAEVSLDVKWLHLLEINTRHSQLEI